MRVIEVEKVSIEEVDILERIRNLEARDNEVVKIVEEIK